MSTITGNPGNNTLIGTPFNDVFQGLAGVDTAVVASLSSNAVFSLDAQGRWVVTSSAGQDTLFGMELVQFTDGLVRLGEDETRVNTTVASAQFHLPPVIAALRGGGYVITWSALGQDGDGFGIYAQRYTADGTAAGIETRVNTMVFGNQFEPGITALSGGGYVVTWMGYTDGGDHDIYARRYAADGTAVGTETRVNTTVSTLHQPRSDPAITALSDGGYVVTWVSEGQDGSGFGIGTYAQRYAADGTAVGSETRVNTTVENNQYFPAITALSGGGYVVTWTSSFQDGSGEGIYAQRYAADGTAAGSETRVNTTLAFAQHTPAIAGLSGGDYVVTWMSAQNGIDFDIYAQRYAADGTAVGSETHINTTVESEQQWPAIAALSDGGYVVTWMSFGQDTSDWGIYAQRFAADGAAVGSETRVNTTVVGGQEHPTITGLSDGGYVVTWYGPDGSDHGIYAQRYAADGTPIGSGTALQGDAGDNVLTFDGAVPVHLLGMEGNDTLKGGSADDLLDGGAGVDAVKSPDTVATGTLSLDAAGRTILAGPQGGADEVRSIETIVYSAAPATPPWSWDDPNMRGLYPELALLAVKAYEGFDPPLPFPTQENTPGWKYGDSALEDAFARLQERWMPLDPTIGFGNAGSSWSHGIYIRDNAAAYVATAIIDGVKTLEIAFRGTDDVLDAIDWLDVSNHYEKFADLVGYLDSYVAANSIGQVFVTGHSLGGSVAQLYLQDHLANPGNVEYRGATFGSPGADTTQARTELSNHLVQFANTRDLVPALGLNIDNITNVAELIAGIANAGLANGLAGVFNYVLSQLAIASAQAVGSDGTPKQGYYDYPGSAVWLDTPLNEWPLASIFNPLEEHDRFLYAEEVWRIAGLQQQLIINTGGSQGAVNLAHVIIGYGDFTNSASFMTGDSLGLDRIEYLVGGRHDDVIKGGSQDDWLWGLAGQDELDGQGGADRMYGGSGDDLYQVDQAGDIVVEQPGQAGGRDEVHSSLGQYVLPANVEDLVLKPNTGLFGIRDARLNGTGNELANELTGNDAANVLAGLGGHDLLLGLDGKDNLTGGAGDDILNGGAGADIMAGGAGNDTYVRDDKNDLVIESKNEGSDTVMTTIDYTLVANLEGLILFGDGAINGTGNVLDNILTGNQAANRLDGQAGNDLLIGDAGNDILIGGLGADRLDSGAGLDTFRFASRLGGGNVDLIEAFVTADDVIEIDRSIFTALKGKGVLAANAFVSGAAALDASDRIIYSASTGALVYDADGTGAVAAVQFATLVGVVGPLSAADFVVA